MKRGAVARGSERDRPPGRHQLPSANYVHVRVCAHLWRNVLPALRGGDASRRSPDRVSAPSGPWAAPAPDHVGPNVGGAAMKMVRNAVSGGDARGTLGFSF